MSEASQVINALKPLSQPIESLCRSFWRTQNWCFTSRNWFHSNTPLSNLVGTYSHSASLCVKTALNSPQTILTLMTLSPVVCYENNLIPTSAGYGISVKEPSVRRMDIFLFFVNYIYWSSDTIYSNLTRLQISAN